KCRKKADDERSDNVDEDRAPRELRPHDLRNKSGEPEPRHAAERATDGDPEIGGDQASSPPRGAPTPTLPRWRGRGQTPPPPPSPSPQRGRGLGWGFGISAAQISAYTCVSALPPGWVTAPVSASPTVCAYFQSVPAL